VAKTRPGRQLRWDVEHLLAIGQQPVRDVPPDLVTALDRPDPTGPLLGVGEQRPVAGRVGGEPATADDGLIAGHDLDRDRALVWVHPDHDPRGWAVLGALFVHLWCLPTSNLMGLSSGEGNATSSCANPS
jgi:hypothetical protein